MSCRGLAWGRAKGRLNLGAIGFKKEHVLLENGGPLTVDTPKSPLRGDCAGDQRPPGLRAEGRPSHPLALRAQEGCEVLLHPGWVGLCPWVGGWGVGRLPGLSRSPVQS